MFFLKEERTPTREERIKDFIIQSQEFMSNYIKDHPELLYKGIPFLFTIYMFFPIFILVWMYLPWIWALYTIYKQIPSRTIAYSIEFFNFYKSRLES